MPIAAGSRLGPYEIVASIGAGGMGHRHQRHPPADSRFSSLTVVTNWFDELKPFAPGR